MGKNSTLDDRIQGFERDKHFREELEKKLCQLETFQVGDILRKVLKQGVSWSAGGRSKWDLTGNDSLRRLKHTHTGCGARLYSDSLLNRMKASRN